MRIWYQSYVDYENGKTYWDRLSKHLEAVVDSGTTVDIKGITPHDSYAHALVEMRCAREVICNAVCAEREGYDAFVIGGALRGSLGRRHSGGGARRGVNAVRLPARPTQRHRHD